MRVWGNNNALQFAFREFADAHSLIDPHSPPAFYHSFKGCEGKAHRSREPKRLGSVTVAQSQFDTKTNEEPVMPTPSSSAMDHLPFKVAMLRLSLWLILFLTAALIALFSVTAFAHHGWTWAEDEQSQLKGTVQAVSMVPPHPTLRVKAEDGVLWQIDLGNPGQTERSGFTAESTKPGDPITVLGNRSKEKGKAHMKAVRITIGDKQYDMYPERIKAE
jgi:hypothetical protein